MTRNASPAPLLDRHVLNGLRRLFGAEFYQALERFLTHSEQYLREMEQAIAAENWQGMMEAAHKVASSAGQFGLMQMAEEAHRLERAWRSGDAEGFRRTAAEVRQSFLEASRLIRDEQHATLPQGAP